MAEDLPDPRRVSATDVLADVRRLVLAAHNAASDDAMVDIGDQLRDAVEDLDRRCSAGDLPDDWRPEETWCSDCGAFCEERHREGCPRYDEVEDGAWGEGPMKEGEAEFLGRQHASGLHDGGPGRPPSGRCFPCTHPIPADFPVRPIESSEAIAAAGALATCGVCHRSWDDAVSTALTPVPAARCPFEYHHPEESA